MVEENIVTNMCVWDGDVTTWTPPANVTMLVQANTPAMVWVLDEDTKQFSLQERIGQGGIGFTWDGTVVTTNQPQPQPLNDLKAEV